MQTPPTTILLHPRPRTPVLMPMTTGDEPPILDLRLPPSGATTQDLLLLTPFTRQSSSTFNLPYLQKANPVSTLATDVLRFPMTVAIKPCDSMTERYLTHPHVPPGRIPLPDSNKRCLLSPQSRAHTPDISVARAQVLSAASIDGGPSDAGQQQ